MISLQKDLGNLLGEEKPMVVLKFAGHQQGFGTLPGQQKERPMKAQTVINDAAHMLVSAQFDRLRYKLEHDHYSWVGGYYAGRRASARFILKAAVQDGGKRRVAQAIREWVAYFREQNAKNNLPVAA